jgi:predicted transcriptional regulator
MDLCVFLPDEIYLIIEVKYCPSTKKLTKKEENALLAKEAAPYFSKDLINQSLTQAVQNKLTPLEINEYFTQPPLSTAERDSILAKAANTVLTYDEMNKTLATLAREKLPQDKLSEILLKIQTGSVFSEEEIDAILSEGTQEALNQILKQDYSGILRINAKEIIELGLAIFGSGSHVKATFRQKPSEDLEQSH